MLCQCTMHGDGSDCLCRKTCDTRCRGQCVCASTPVVYEVHCIRAIHGFEECGKFHTVDPVAVRRCNEGLCGDEVKQPSLAHDESYTHAYPNMNARRCKCREACDTPCGGLCACARDGYTYGRLERQWNWYGPDITPEFTQEIVEATCQQLTHTLQVPAAQFPNGFFEQYRAWMRMTIEHGGMQDFMEYYLARFGYHLCDFARYLLTLNPNAVRDFGRKADGSACYRFQMVGTRAEFIDMRNPDRWLVYTYIEALDSLVACLMCCDIPSFRSNCDEENFVDSAENRELQREALDFFGSLVLNM